MRCEGLLAVGLVLASFAGPAFAASPGPVALPPIIAKQIVSAKRSGISVLVPSTIGAGLPASHLFGSGGRSGKGYDIQLAAAPGCDDANACFVAELWGGSGKLDLRTRVALTKGISGAFRASSCGASCAPATIEWLEYGSRYTIQFMGSRATLVALANSAIAAGPR